MEREILSLKASTKGEKVSYLQDISREGEREAETLRTESLRFRVLERQRERKWKEQGKKNQMGTERAKMYWGQRDKHGKK